MTGKALDQAMRQNLRQLRVMGLANEIERRIEKASPSLYRAERHERTAVYYAIIETLMGVGAELITDEMRAEAGLPPRGPDGWTAEELFAIEQKRLEALYAPLQPAVLPIGALVPGQCSASKQEGGDVGNNCAGCIAETFAQLNEAFPEIEWPSVRK